MTLWQASKQVQKRLSGGRALPKAAKDPKGMEGNPAKSPEGGGEGAGQRRSKHLENRRSKKNTAGKVFVHVQSARLD